MKKIPSVLKKIETRNDVAAYLSVCQSQTGLGKLMSHAHEVEFHIQKDGAIFLCESRLGESQIYLYPEQVKHLLKVIESLDTNA